VPVCVDIPVRVRVDPHALQVRLTEVKQAVRTAAERAMASSVRVVLAPRGTYLGTCVDAPTFAWGGPGLARVPVPMRRQAERLLTDALHQAAQGAGVTDWGSAADPAPEVLPSDPAAKFDRARYRSRTGVYEVPSYDAPRKKAEKRQVPLKAKKSPKQRKMRTAADFIPYAGYDDRFRDHLYGAIWNRWGEQSANWPKVLCALYRMSGVDGFVLNVYRVQDGRLSNLTYYNFIAWRPIGDEPKLPPVLVVTETYEFAFESGGGASVGLTNYRLRAEEYCVQRLLKQEAEKKKGIMTEGEERVAAVQSEAHEKVMKYTAGWETAVAAYWNFRAAGEFRFVMPIKDAAVAAALSPYQGTPLPVLSLSNLTELVIEREAEGSEAADGDGLQDTASLAPGQGGGIEEGFGPNAGVIIAPRYAESPYGSLYPGTPFGSERITTECKPWRDEPSTEQLPGAEALRALIQEIAARLEIPPCLFAVNFAINAARVVGERAEQVTNFSIGEEQGYMAPLSRVAQDRKGKYYFEAIRSVSIQHLRRLAEIFPLLRKLLLEVFRIFGPVGERQQQRFREQVRAAVNSPALESVQKLFIYACQISLIQLLNTTRKNIEDRRNNFDNYLQTFQTVLVAELTEIAELVLLRNALERFTDLVGDTKGEAAFEKAVGRLSLENLLPLRDPLDISGKNRRELALLRSQPESKDLMLRLADPDLWVQRRGLKAGHAAAGTIFERAGDGAWVIRDSHGATWTLDELKWFVAKRTEYAQEMDPLVSQISDLVGLAKRAEDPQWIESFVGRLLDQMYDKNRAVKGQTEYDHRYAFSHGQIFEDYQKPTVHGTRFNLQGIHRIAHEAIGDCFEGDDFYHLGLSALLDRERAGSIWDLLIMIDGIAMSILCPPLGTAIFIAQGIYEGLESLHHAEEQKEIYGALVNPEQVLSRMEIEIEIFCAKLGIALSVLGAVPEAKAIAEAAIAGVRTAARKTISEAVRAGFSNVSRTILEHSLKSMADAMKRGIILTFFQQLAVQEILNGVIGVFVNDLVELRIAELEKQAKAEGWFEQ
jgi:hypothetical protein